MDNSSIQNYTLGAGAGYLSYKGAKKVASKVSRPYGKLFLAKMQSTTPEEQKLLKKAAQKALVDSGLKGKKIYLHDVNEQNAQQIRRLFDKKALAYVAGRLKKDASAAKSIQDISELLKKKEYKKAWQEYKKIFKNKPASPAHFAAITDINAKLEPQKLNPKALKPMMKNGLKMPLLYKIKKLLKILNPPDKKLDKIFNAVVEGRNAFFHPMTRDIMVNMNKLAGSAFHEMGHALNSTGSSKLIKALKVRYFTPQLVPLILGVGLFKNKKAEGEKVHGFFDKATTFIKNNAGVITFGAMVPVMAEEGLASIRGGKLAKKVLTPELLKKVNKGNALAWGSYLLSALLLTGAVKAGIAVRDKVAQRNI